MIITPFAPLTPKTAVADASFKILNDSIKYYINRNVRKIKLGLFQNAESFPIERSYKLVFKILGVGLFFLSLALLSGFAIQSIFTNNLIIKSEAGQSVLETNKKEIEIKAHELYWI